MSEVTIPADRLEQAARGELAPAATITLEPPGRINVDAETRGEVFVSETETPVVTHSVLACYTREPPPDWNGDPIIPDGADLCMRNPAPDASVPMVPTGVYRKFTVTR